MHQTCETSAMPTLTFASVATKFFRHVLLLENLFQSLKKQKITINLEDPKNDNLLPSKLCYLSQQAAETTPNKRILYAMKTAQMSNGNDNMVPACKALVARLRDCTQWDMFLRGDLVMTVEEEWETVYESYYDHIKIEARALPPVDCATFDQGSVHLIDLLDRLAKNGVGVAGAKYENVEFRFMESPGATY